MFIELIGSRFWSHRSQRVLYHTHAFAPQFDLRPESHMPRGGLHSACANCVCKRWQFRNRSRSRGFPAPKTRDRRNQLPKKRKGLDSEPLPAKPHFTPSQNTWYITTPGKSKPLALCYCKCFATCQEFLARLGTTDSTRVSKRRFSGAGKPRHKIYGFSQNSLGFLRSSEEFMRRWPPESRRRRFPTSELHPRRAGLRP